MAKLRIPRERVEKMLVEQIRAGEVLEEKIKVAEKTWAYRDWLDALEVWRKDTITALKTAYEGRDIAFEFEAVTGATERSSPKFTFEYSKRKVRYGITKLEDLIDRLQLALPESEDVAGIKSRTLYASGEYAEAVEKSFKVVRDGVASVCGNSPSDFAAMKTVTLTKKVLGKSQQLIVDGEVWEDSSGHKSAHSQRMSAYFRGSSLSKIAKLTLSQLSAHFEQVTLDLPDSDANPFGLYGWEFNSINVGMDQTDGQGRIKLRCEVYYEFENWSNTYTIADLAQSIQDVLGEHPELPLTYWTRDSIVEGFGVQVAARHEDTIEHVLLLQKDLLDLGDLVENHIDEKERRDFADCVGEAPPPHKFSVPFSFPAPVKSACEQYLLYFGQFLSDLGIQVETELAEKKAARVFFSVTPIDATQALTQIRDALVTYLRLPVLPEFAATASQFHDPAVAQLQANVLHYQSQTVLAKSFLQLKDATIQAKDAEIEFLKGTIDLTGFVARPKKSHEESSSEPLIKDVVSVKKYTYKFLEFDFPAILTDLPSFASGVSALTHA